MKCNAVVVVVWGLNVVAAADEESGESALVVELEGAVCGMGLYCGCCG